MGMWHRKADSNQGDTTPLSPLQKQWLDLAKKAVADRYSDPGQVEVRAEAERAARDIIVGDSTLELLGGAWHESVRAQELAHAAMTGAVLAELAAGTPKSAVATRAGVSRVTVHKAASAISTLTLENVSGRRRPPEMFFPACAGGVCGHCAACMGQPTFADRAAFYDTYPQLGDGWHLAENSAKGPLGSDVAWTMNRYVITVAHADGPQPDRQAGGPGRVAVAWHRDTGKIHVLGEDVGHAEATQRWGHLDIDPRAEGE